MPRMQTAHTTSPHHAAPSSARSSVPDSNRFPTRNHADGRADTDRPDTQIRAVSKVRRVKLVRGSAAPAKRDYEGRESTGPTLFSRQIDIPLALDRRSVDTEHNDLPALSLVLRRRAMADQL